MKPYCVLVVKHVLPALRAKVATELIDRGYKVSDVANMMGLTQAAVSQYIYSKRGQKGIKIIEKSKRAQNVIKELVENLAARKVSIEDEVDYLCRICMILREEGLISERDKNF